MHWDRWVLPPAIAAGVFAAVAVSPPVGVRVGGLIVDLAGEVLPGRPLLVAVTRVEAGQTPPGSWNARLTLTDRQGGLVARTVAHAVDATGPALGVLATAGDGPWRLRATA